MLPHSKNTLFDPKFENSHLGHGISQNMKPCQHSQNSQTHTFRNITLPTLTLTLSHSHTHNSHKLTKLTLHTSQLSQKYFLQNFENTNFTNSHSHSHTLTLSHSHSHTLTLSHSHSSLSQK